MTLKLGLMVGLVGLFLGIYMNLVNDFVIIHKALLGLSIFLTAHYMEVQSGLEYQIDQIEII